MLTTETLWKYSNIWSEGGNLEGGIWSCYTGASEAATLAMIFWPRRNYYMKEKHDRNKIYVRASMHLVQS